MLHNIKKVGVIGAGIMGASIAAHLANIEIKTILLDIVPSQTDGENSLKKSRNYLAEQGLASTLKSKPASFYIPEDKKFITIGNLEDNLDLLKDCDWIIEAIVENLEIKKKLFSKIEKIAKDNALLTTNTSGISIDSISKHLSNESQSRFFGTHFFNPPRYMKLFEIIPGPKTDDKYIKEMKIFAEKHLGKGIVFAKDTPNFIGNRIGLFTGCLTNKLMEKFDISIEQVDALTGTLIGRPKTGTYRLADLVGLDIMTHVAENVCKNCTEDERLDVFSSPPWILKMLEKGYLGNKTKGGMYKKIKNEKGKTEILVLDWKTLKYNPLSKDLPKSLKVAKAQNTLKDKINSIFYSKDQSGKFVFELLSETLIYAANRIPEISDDIINIDNAMKWGFNWKTGPFEIWDLLGFKKSTTKMKEAGYILPKWILEMLESDRTSFYKQKINEYYDIRKKSYEKIEISSEIILLPSLKKQNKIVSSNNGASIIDLDDGIICLEFHTKMNSLGADIISMIDTSCKLIEEGQFEGLVIANQGSNFSVGANLMLILFTAQEEEWDELDFMVNKLQSSFMRLKYLPKPVIVAPHNMALGGGCECCLHADRVVAAAETYIGLVEVGVGVIPAGGGTKELLIRNTEERIFRIKRGGIYPKDVYLLPFVARAFENIALAKVATSAKEAIKMGILRNTDKISYNSDYRIKMAKNNAIALNLEGYTAPHPMENIRVMGKDAIGTFCYALHNMKESGFATPHDVTVAKKLAYVITGGDVLPNTEVSEQYLLDLEREAFLSLCGTKETQARMSHMLKTGKPLRN